MGELQGRDWGAQGTQISGTPGGHRANASGDKPWEVALGAGGPLGGGKDGKSNPEITPLEVCTRGCTYPVYRPQLMLRITIALPLDNGKREMA